MAMDKATSLSGCRYLVNASTFSRHGADFSPSTLHALVKGLIQR